MKHLSLTILHIFALTAFMSLQASDDITVITSVSVGELLDKITILQIKLQRVKSSKKLANIHLELETLQKMFAGTGLASQMLDTLIDELRTVNETLWDLEDATRRKESHHNYDEEFKQLAALIIDRNDTRARIKAAINKLTNSTIIEEKSYKEMTSTKKSSHTNSTLVAIEIPFAELIDKITILEVKLEKITDPNKRANIQTELALLCKTRDELCSMTPELEKQTTLLRISNRTMFAIQDAIREKIREKLLDDEFVHLARSVYFTNDERCRIKRVINEIMGSHLIEEKEYTQYDTIKTVPA